MAAVADISCHVVPTCRLRLSAMLTACASVCSSGVCMPATSASTCMQSGTTVGRCAALNISENAPTARCNWSGTVGLTRAPASACKRGPLCPWSCSSDDHQSCRLHSLRRQQHPQLAVLPLLHRPPAWLPWHLPPVLCSAAALPLPPPTAAAAVHPRHPAAAAALQLISSL